RLHPRVAIAEGRERRAVEDEGLIELADQRFKLGDRDDPTRLAEDPALELSQGRLSVEMADHLLEKVEGDQEGWGDEAERVFERHERLTTMLDPSTRERTDEGTIE